MVSAVRGWAAGIGCPLALYGDYVVASETARFWTPFVRRGFTPDSGSTWLLPRLVGVQRAKQMLLLGRVIDAPTAGQWGLVSEVVADGDFDAAVEAVVAEFASAATVSVGLARQLINRGLELDLAHALTAEAAAEEVSLRSADFKEGIAAMRERREADFSGR